MEATSPPKVEESGACLARCPRRTKMVTERYASMGCRRLAHDRTLEYVYMYICMYIHKYFASRNCRAADLDQPTKPTAASSKRGVAGQVLRNMGVPSRMPPSAPEAPRQLQQGAHRGHRDVPEEMSAAIQDNPTQLHTATHTHSCIHAYPSTFTYTRSRTYVHSYTRSIIHSYVRTSIHTYIRTAHTRTRTRTRTHTHTLL